MKDDNKTKEQLVIELTELRSQNAALKRSITGSSSAELVAEEAHRYAKSKELDRYHLQREKLTVEQTKELQAANAKLRREVVECRRSEEALRESEERYKSIVGSVKLGITLIDKNHKIIMTNKFFAELFNKLEADFVGKNCFKEYEKRAVICPHCPGVLAMASGKPAEVETEGVRDDGSRFNALVRTVPTFASDGTASGFIEVVEDITERKQAEQRLSEEMNLKNFLLDLNDKALVLPDKDLYNYVLDHVVRMTDSTIGFFHLVSDDQKNVILTAWNKEALKNCTAAYTTHYPLEQAGNWVDCVRLKHPVLYNDFAGSPSREGLPEGHTPITRFMSIPVVEGDNVRVIFGVGNKSEEYNEFDVVRLQVVANDLQRIMAQRRAEEDLRESQEYARILFTSSHIPLIVMDAETGVFIDCNTAAAKISGYAIREEILGKTPLDMSSPIQYNGSDSTTEVKKHDQTCRENGSDVFEWRCQRPDGQIWDAEIHLMFLQHRGKPLIQFTFQDITERKRAAEKIQYLATHDILTELPNRFMFSQLLIHAIQTAQRYQRQFAVLFIDLDRFKIINDTLGHEEGDKLLQEIARRLKLELRAVDVVARLGGDEFVILIEEVSDSSQIATVAHKILASVIKPIILLGEECRITASIGICMYPKDAEDEQSLMKNADLAMYLAKEEGKNNYQFYTEDIQSKSLERRSIETHLHFALERNELSLHYQAKVDFKTNAITGVEALLRWQSPYLGSVTPTQFIPVAEETGLIVSIGKWVIKTACAQNVAWQQQGLPAVCMAVNLSLRQLMDDNLIADIGTALNDSGMAPNLLELEITESMVMHDPVRIVSILAKIKGMGVRLAIDDFGTGYASLAHIKRFSVNTLKIDRSFIRNIPEDAEGKAIAEAIIAMGKALNLAVVAEGVETIEQMNFLKDQSCDEMQGYYFSKPIMPEQFADLLRKNVFSPQKVI